MKYSTKYRLRESISITIFMTVIFLVFHLGIEILTVEQFREIGFSKGYATINGEKIGHHILSYILMMIVAFFALFFSSKVIFDPY